MIHLTDSISLIEVPEEAYDFEFSEVDKTIIMFCTKEYIKYVTTPKGSYIILGTIRNGNPDFDVEPYVYDGNAVDLAKVSERADTLKGILSLLQSKQVDMSKHYLVIEKK